MEIIERDRRPNASGKEFDRVLIAIAVDNHLSIRFPLALLDHRCVAGLVLLDHGWSFAISVPVALVRASRHSGSDPRPNSDTNADFFGVCGHCGAYARRSHYCQYVLHEPLLSVLKPAPIPCRTGEISGCSDIPKLTTVFGARNMAARPEQFSISPLANA